MLKKFLLVIIGITALSIAGWYAYQLRLAYIDHTPYIKATQDEMVENFHENKDVFYDILQWGSQIETLEDFRIEKDNEISFILRDSLRTSYFKDDYAYFFLGETDHYNIEEVRFLDSNVMQVLVNGNWQSNTNWDLHYYGDKNHKFVSTLLAYHNIETETLDLIIKNLIAINCKGFSKNGDVITLVYRGIPLQSLNYIIPFNDSINGSKWTRIEDHFYIEQYDSGMNCDIADWYNY